MAMVDRCRFDMAVIGYGDHNGPNQRVRAILMCGPTSCSEITCFAVDIRPRELGVDHQISWIRPVPRPRQESREWRTCRGRSSAFLLGRRERQRRPLCLEVSI